MKAALAVIFLAISAFAQDLTVSAAESACGPNNVEFRVKTADVHSLPPPDAGKALVYVIEEQKFKAVKDVTARVGLDGVWVGANHGNSYLFFSVEPGEHHLCTDWTSTFVPGGRLVSLANLTAEAGKVYFFRARSSGGVGDIISDRRLQTADGASIDLELVNSDEGKLLVASSSLSISSPKNQRASK